MGKRYDHRQPLVANRGAKMLDLKASFSVLRSPFNLKKQLYIFPALILVFGCASYRDYGIYDKKVPLKEQCILNIPDDIKVLAFDSVNQNWPQESNILIPIGEHTLKARVLGSYGYTGAAGSHITVSMSSDAFELSYDFIPKHKYTIRYRTINELSDDWGYKSDGEYYSKEKNSIEIYIKDITDSGGVSAAIYDNIYISRNSNIGIGLNFSRLIDKEPVYNSYYDATLDVIKKYYTYPMLASNMGIILMPFEYEFTFITNHLHTALKFDYGMDVGLIVTGTLLPAYRWFIWGYNAGATAYIYPNRNHGVGLGGGIYGDCLNVISAITGEDEGKYLFWPYARIEYTKYGVDKRKTRYYFDYFLGDFMKEQFGCRIGFGFFW